MWLQKPHSETNPHPHPQLSRQALQGFVHCDMKIMATWYMRADTS